MKNKFFKFIILPVLCLAAAGLIVSGSINIIMTASTFKNIITPETAQENGDYDCIIVLGAKVMPDGSLSAMLEDRVKTGISLYEHNSSGKILMSGDHGRKGYNEVGAMKNYAMDKGIESDNLFMDHAGFSTYDSIYRAKEIFGAKRILIVTQKYHLYRAIYIANRLGLEADGVSADLRDYRNGLYNNSREYLARLKAFAMCIYKPEPVYLGEAIPISGNGNSTNDEALSQ